MKKLRYLAAAMLLCLPVTLFAAGTVDINTADKETLMNLNGIGESFAERIIEYREQNGGFKAVQELTNIRGIGQTLVEKNREMLTVGDSPE
ncbi:MAG: helix-hairpin-helix domain-containing protein [Gammaproteobacteria bacterium]|nr:helix-hairpin-helix domain-containing protein [Gammaproteobacteria bacterium]MDE0284606.1 helix-hairpin-helix domain-containing protein [Gammaproteobacteria bacterium]